MADAKTTALTELTAPSADDLLYIIDAPGTVPVSKKVTIANLFGNMPPSTIKGTSATDLPTYSAEFLLDTGWTSVDWTGDFASGWTHTPGNTTALSQSKAAVNATKYQIAYTVTGRTAGTFDIGFGGETLTGQSATGAWGPTTSSTASLTITPTSLFDGTIVISIKSITAISSPILSLQSSDATARIEARSSNSTYNTFMGVDAGEYTTTGIWLTAFGYQALMYNTTGLHNVAVGYATLRANTVGKSNTGIGTSCLTVNTTGGYNSAIGASALNSNTTGSNNTALGYATLKANTTASSNTAVGYGALEVATAASNTAVGYGSLRASTTGNTNVAIGNASGLSITTGSGNVFIGTSAGYHASQKVDAANSMALGGNAYTTASNQVVLGDANITQTLLRGNVLIGTTTDGLTAGGSLAIEKDFAHRGANAGFYNHALTAQQVLATGAGATVDNVITALQALGLVKQS